MFTGSARVDITPSESVAMDGMIRAHGSEGVHDHIHTRVIVLGNTLDPEDNYALISVDICGISTDDCCTIRERVSSAISIPVSNVVVSSTHTHSGPAAHGFFDNKETRFVDKLMDDIVQCSKEAFDGRVETVFASASGEETTISNYRRLMSKSGKVIMNWEPFDPEDIVGPLGIEDTEVGVLRFDAKDTGKPVAVLFNHAGHPNVMSGDNYLISGDYTGFAQTKLEGELGCVCAFFNGAQGTMDIDGLKDRDWEGVERTGNALADAVLDTLKKIPAGKNVKIYSEIANFTVPIREISDEDYAWAKDVWEKCGGKLTPLADGVGDDYKANLYIKLRESDRRQIPMEFTCIVIGDTALLTFPGELYTEIGMQIKKQSPFEKTYILGITNGYEGYFPTKQAVIEGGYAEDTRKVEAISEDIILEQSAALLSRAFSRQ